MANKYGKKSKMEKNKTSRQEVAVAKVEQRMQQRSYFPYINILVILEAVMGTLLCRIAALKYGWIQVIIIAIQIALGFAFDRVGFMISMSVVYALTLVVMWVRRRTLK